MAQGHNMKAVACRSRVPPPPQKINDYLNGYIIGHYVMKKALSVAIYNHFCNTAVPGYESSLDTLSEDRKADIVEDTSSFFTRQDGQSVGEMLAREKSPPSSEETTSPESHATAIADCSPVMADVVQREYMSPIIARVIIEASSHKIHLQKSNTLTFDPTGSSKPLNAIAIHLAQYLDVPYVRCDCSKLAPVQKIEPTVAKPSPTSGTLGQLLSGFTGETVNTVISRLYRNADFDIDRAQRGIILLDGMDRIGENACMDDMDETKRAIARKQVLKEILRIVDGTNVDVTRAAHNDDDDDEGAYDEDNSEYLDTSNIFFVCFGVSDNLFYKNNLEIESGYSSKKASAGSPALSTDAHGIHEDMRQLSVVAAEITVTGTEETPAIIPESTNSPKGCYAKTRRDHLCVPSPWEENNNKVKKVDDKKSPRKPQVVATPDDEEEDDYDDEDDEYYTDDDDDWEAAEEERELAQLVEEIMNEPIPHCQSLWGMKDVELTFRPEALEMIAKQAYKQNAGRDGVSTILEKLFMNIKFDILGTDVAIVEITEESVVGKERPIYYRKGPGSNGSPEETTSGYSERTHEDYRRNSIATTDSRDAANRARLKCQEQKRSLQQGVFRRVLSTAPGSGTNSPLPPEMIKSLDIDAEVEERLLSRRMTEWDIDVLHSLELE